MSAHPNNHPADSGSNPDYYAETASVAGNPPSGPSNSDPSHHQGDTHAAAQPPQYQEQLYPPPPEGAPPSGHHQEYYPPPPPGPPPSQSHNYHPLQSHPYSPAPPSYTEQIGGQTFPIDEKPPILPPRPSSSHSQSHEQYHGQGQGQGQAPYFAPPPGGPEMHGAGPSVDQHGGYAAAAASGPVSSDHVTDAKKKKTFGERFYDWSVKAGVPINKVTNKLGSEAFWPTSMDKECDKAARILKSFCKDGFYTTTANHPPPSPGHASNPGPNPSSKSKTLVKVPPEAIKQAKGLAIFTTFRTGLHISGASGSGIVLSRLPDGSWSPPSGFLVHALGAGFMVGLDIYDCVCVLNTEDAVRAFTRPRFSLGGEMAVVAGPIGAGAGLDAAIGGGKPVWSYIKSRGFYAGVQADGTIIVQRPDANAAFYAEKNITPERILRGDVKSTGGVGSDVNGKGEVVLWPTGARQLVEVLKSAEGKHADQRVVDDVGMGPTPGDLAGMEGVGHPGKEKEAEMGAGVRYT
ncbi:putative SH3 domain-containing YSC84-like protein 1 [Xylariales sp. AK1849]|nr:putative SH3 domain-containing YSC84-like protein 1 [Xylariales sp. AK1849]